MLLSVERTDCCCTRGTSDESSPIRHSLWGNGLARRSGCCGCTGGQAFYSTTKMERLLDMNRLCWKGVVGRMALRLMLSGATAVCSYFLKQQFVALGWKISKNTGGGDEERLYIDGMSCVFSFICTPCFLASVQRNEKANRRSEWEE